MLMLTSYLSSTVREHIATNIDTCLHNTTEACVRGLSKSAAKGAVSVATAYVETRVLQYAAQFAMRRIAAASMNKAVETVWQGLAAPAQKVRDQAQQFVQQNARQLNDQYILPHVPEALKAWGGVDAAAKSNANRAKSVIGSKWDAIKHAASEVVAVILAAIKMACDKVVLAVQVAGSNVAASIHNGFAALGKHPAEPAMGQSTQSTATTQTLAVKKDH